MEEQTLQRQSDLLFQLLELFRKRKRTGWWGNTGARHHGEECCFIDSMIFCFLLSFSNILTRRAIEWSSPRQMRRPCCPAQDCGLTWNLPFSNEYLLPQESRRNSFDLFRYVIISTIRYRRDSFTFMLTIFQQYCLNRCREFGLYKFHSRTPPLSSK